MFGLAVLLIATSTAFAQSDERAETLSKILTLRGELRSLEDKLLEPSRADFEKNSDFLKAQGAGMIRIMPREVFDKAGMSAIRGGGAYYSFARKTHEYGYGSDISLELEMLSVAGGEHGVIGKTLASIQTPTKIADARTMQRQLGEGGLLNGIQVGRRVRAVVGRTYVLRSVNYDRSDILVCFQLVRRDSDGTYILLWKMLQEFGKPSLDRESERPLPTISLGTEYKVIRTVGPESNQETLNKLSIEGWELVAVDNQQAFLRRRK
jgi:hypothetical protein